MPSIKYKDKTYGSATFPFVEMTREEYDMLPPSKQNDGTLYLISDDDVGWGAERCVYDNTQSGLAASNVQDVVDELDRIIDTIENPTFSEASARDNIISGESLAIIFGKIKRVINDLETIAFSGMANNVEYDNTTSGMTATDVQGALDELNANINSDVVTSIDRSGKQFTAKNSSGTTLFTFDQQDSDTVYTHPTTSGNKHIPSGGSSGQILRWSADGTAAWGADNNTVYTHPTGNGNNHIPAGGSSGQILRWSAAGTAAWGADNNTTTGTSYAAGSCPNNTTFATQGSVYNAYNHNALQVRYNTFSQTIGNFAAGTPGTRALQYTINCAMNGYTPIAVAIKSHPSSAAMLCYPFLKGDSDTQFYLNVYRAQTGAYSSGGTCQIRVTYRKN